MVNVPPVSGFSPEAMGSSQRFSVTGCDARASGMPPGPTGQPPAALVLVPGVLPPQAARKPGMLESEIAAPPARSSASRRVYPRSLGWNVIGSLLVATVAHRLKVRRSPRLMVAVARASSSAVHAD